MGDMKTPALLICTMCGGDGDCPECGDDGSVCGMCASVGKCPECGGSGTDDEGESQ